MTWRSLDELIFPCVYEGLPHIQSRRDKLMQPTTGPSAVPSFLLFPLPPFPDDPLGRLLKVALERLILSHAEFVIFSLR